MAWVVTVIAVDDATRSVLVDGSPGAADGGVAHLPTVELPSGDPKVDEVANLIERLLDRPITPIWTQFEEADDAAQDGICAVLTIADPARDARAGRAFMAAEAIVQTLEPPMARAPISAWLDRLAGHADPGTPPWLEPGWFERVGSWMAERMTAAGVPPTGPPRMTYQSPIGTVLRATSGERDVYLKCPAPHFRAEASITRALATRTPGWVPEVIDIEPAEGWLLMSDLGDHQLGGDPEATWSDGLRRLGEIQCAWVGHLDELVEAGGQRRPLAGLTVAVPGLLDGNGLGARLEPALLERWSVAVPRLVDACRELEDIDLPDALVHGDAHPWNIAVTERGPVVFDWSDTAAGPSFVDLAVFLRRPKDLAVRRVLLDAYLEPWAGVAPRDRLERAAELAMSVGGLYQIVTYNGLLPSLPPEDRVVYGGADVHWVVRSLDGLEHGLEAVSIPP
jgi:phosphotransferase family enzyme